MYLLVITTFQYPQAAICQHYFKVYIPIAYLSSMILAHELLGTTRELFPAWTDS